METNYLGAYMVTQSFVPIMIKEAIKKRGLDRPSIIMVNSFAGKVRLISDWRSWLYFLFGGRILTGSQALHHHG